jgi:hypothetical protein
MLLGLAFEARGDSWFVVGQGGQNGDCMMEWQLEWGSAEPDKDNGNPARVQARQDCCDREAGDAATTLNSCDLPDGQGNSHTGICHFRVGLCFCVEDPTMAGADQCNGTNGSIAKWCGSTRLPPQEFYMKPPTRTLSSIPPGDPSDPNDTSWATDQKKLEQWTMFTIRDSVTNAPNLPGVVSDNGPNLKGKTNEFRIVFDRGNPSNYLRTTDADSQYPKFGIVSGSTSACTPLVDVYVRMPFRENVGYRRASITLKGMKGYFRKTAPGLQPGPPADGTPTAEIDRSGDRLRLTCLPATYSECMP